MLKLILIALINVVACLSPPLFAVTYAGLILNAPQNSPRALYLNGDAGNGAVLNYLNYQHKFYMPFDAALYGVSLATTGSVNKSHFRCDSSIRSIDIKPTIPGPANEFIAGFGGYFPVTQGEEISCGRLMGESSTDPGNVYLTLWFNYTHSSYVYPLWFAGKHGASLSYTPYNGYFEEKCDPTMLSAGAFPGSISKASGLLPMDMDLTHVSSNIVDISQSGKMKVLSGIVNSTSSYTLTTNVHELSTPITYYCGNPVTVTANGFSLEKCVNVAAIFAPKHPVLKTRIAVVFGGNCGTTSGRLYYNGHPQRVLTTLANWVIPSNEFILPPLANLQFEGVASTHWNPNGSQGGTFFIDYAQDTSAREVITYSSAYTYELKTPVNWNGQRVSVRWLPTNSIPAGETTLTLFFSY